VLSFGRAIALGVEPGGTLAVIAVTHASTAAWSLPALAFARPLQALDVESEAAVILVSEARDEALLAVGPDLLRYSTASGRVVERRQGPDGMLQDAAWSADGGVVAVAAAADGTAYVLERGSGRARALRTEGRAIHVAVDAAGEVVAVATEIGVVALFSTRDEAAPPRVATPSLQPPGELAFAGDLLWIAGSDGVLRALDGSGAEVARSAVGSPLVALAIAPGGRLAATAARDRIVRIHALAGGDAVEALAWHASRVTGVAFGAGRTLLSADVDGELAAWDLPPPP
jgi:WD40 repeat protein